MEVKKGYKQTEVGVIPVEWEVTSLGHLSEFVTSGSRGWASYYAERGPLFVRSQNVRDGRLDFADQQRVCPPAGAEVSRTRLKRNDLLVTVTGNSVGNVAWVAYDLGDAYVSQHVGLVRLLEPSIAEYVCRFLAPGSPGNPQIWSSQAGQSKPGLKLTDLREFMVALPPTRAEQEAIAGALSDADAWIESLEQLIAKKRQIKQGAMQELLTGQTRLPGLTAEWEAKRIGEMLTICHGRSQRDVEDPNGLYPIFGTGGQIGSASRSLYDKPSVLIGRKGTINQPRYMETPFWTVDTLFYSSMKEGNNAKFLYYRFCLIDWLQYNEASGVPSLNARTIENVEIAAPGPAEQAEIATVLSDMDAEIAALEAKVTKARQIKQGMMQELLTGRIRLV